MKLLRYGEIGKEKPGIFSANFRVQANCNLKKKGGMEVRKKKSPARVHRGSIILKGT